MCHVVEFGLGSNIRYWIPPTELKYWLIWSSFSLSIYWILNQKLVIELIRAIVKYLPYSTCSMLSQWFLSIFDKAFRRHRNELRENFLFRVILKARPLSKSSSCALVGTNPPRCYQKNSQTLGETPNTGIHLRYIVNVARYLSIRKIPVQKHTYWPHHINSVEE